MILDNTEALLNGLYAGKYRTVAETCLSRYLSNHEEIEFLHWRNVALILNNSREEFITFVKSEHELSGNPHLVIIVKFLRAHNITLFSDADLLLELGFAFQKNHGFRKYSDIYFRSCQIAEPGNYRNLTAIGENAICTGNISLGIQYMRQAAGEYSKKMPDV